MVNLSTVYAISIVLASVAGMGSAFVGHKFYPIIGGAAIPPPSPDEVYTEAKKTAALAERLANAQIPPKAEETVEPVYTRSPEPQPAPLPSAPPAEPEPEVPAKSEDIPAEAPTDTNNEPAEIPTYLPEQEEENPKGGSLGLVDEIQRVFGKDEVFASNMVAFIVTPVQNWTQIASTPEELFEKFKETLNDPALPNCPTPLMDLCKLVVLKYTNMEKFTKGDSTATLYGDQTDVAVKILSNIA